MTNPDYLNSPDPDSIKDPSSLSELQRVQLPASEYERQRDQLPNPDGYVIGSVLGIEEELRPALLTELLRIEIQHLVEGGKFPPTLSQLQVRYAVLDPWLAVAYRKLDADDQTEYRIPYVLGGYRLEEVVGQGTQSRVAFAHLVSLPEKKGVVKYSRSGQPTARLLSESRFLARLKGCGVPDIENVGTAEDGVAYLILERLQGKNLEDYLEQSTHTKKGLVWAAKIVCDIAKFVAMIHANKVLHRDLKPANIFVESEERIRILDFGLAIDQNSGFDPQPPVGEFWGAPAYKSPEQLVEDSSVPGELSDIFAIGRILLACCCGSEAVIESYHREHPDKVHVQSTDAPIPTISSRWLAQIQTKATHPDPGIRYQSAAELTYDLERYLFWQQVRRWGG
ncbi:serine/threonine-protein kinase [Bremerella sp. JC770]|uniref:serine/threonine protein kinase n=1 Tax=Bremerella sp. JC770 TaxID=3232137 RepID=UPI00345B2EA6